MKTVHAAGFANKSILFVLAAALAAGLGLVAAQRYWPGSRASADLPLPAMKTVRLFQAPRALPDFRLARDDGSALTPASLRGHWTIVFLGFTHCPDVCPTTLTSLKQAQDAWTPIPAAIRPRVLFVSVDPERDTPKIVGDYAHYFHADTLAATVGEPALQDFAHGLGLVYMKVPLAGGDYTMDHSATLVVLDPQGRQAGLIRPPLLPADIAADLAALTERRP
jgi:protein SCO1